MNMQQAHNLFIRECTDGTLRRRASGTIENYVSSFDLFIKITKITDTFQLTEQAMRGFLRVGEEKRNWKPNTTLTHRKNLSPFISWCIGKKMLVKDPLEKIPYPRTFKKLPEYYTEDQMEKIVYYADMYSKDDFLRARNRAIIGVLSLTGLRKGELLELKMRDIDFEKMVLKVRAEHAKNGRDRVIPISTTLAALLRDYIALRAVRDDMTPWLWLSDRNGRFTSAGLKHFINNIVDKVGFNVKLHKFRHTFATNHCGSGGDLASLQQVLGHKEITTTMIYAHVMPEHLRASVELNQLNQFF